MSFYRPPPDEGGEPPQDSLARAIRVLRRLRDTFTAKGTIPSLDPSDDFALKQCFNAAVTAYVRSEAAASELESIFRGWNHTLTARSVQVLVFLISNAPAALAGLIEHLNSRLKQDPQLVELYVAQHVMLLDKYSGELDGAVQRLANAESNHDSARLLARMVMPMSPVTESNVRFADADANPSPAVLQQVRRMTLALCTGAPNLAFNHLLNAFHGWCYANDRRAAKPTRNEYNRQAAICG